LGGKEKRGKERGKEGRKERWKEGRGSEGERERGKKEGNYLVPFFFCSPRDLEYDLTVFPWWLYC
jgi:hypothetical protein